MENTYKIKSVELETVCGITSTFPENEKIVMLLDLGYAAEDAKPLPNHGNRKPLEETVSYI